MRKIRLGLDNLAVESFHTAEEAGNTAGTVHGHAITAVCPATSYPRCYPSYACSLQGPYQLTCAPDCMTNANGYC